jgi:hypothetical protein
MLTKDEKIWVKKLQSVLDEQPSERIAYYTTGDQFLYAFDVSRSSEINKVMHGSNMDFCEAVRKLDADMTAADINFKNPVESTAG